MLDTTMPYREFETKDLYLRRLDKAHAQALLTLRSNHEVNRYIDRAPTTTQEEALTFIQDIQDQLGRSCHYWALVLKQTNQLIGTTCLLRFNADRTVCEVGYELDPTYHGLGYMRQAVREVIEFGFGSLQLVQILGVVHPDNLPSRRLLEYFDFQLNSSSANSVTYFLPNPT